MRSSTTTTNTGFLRVSTPPSASIAISTFCSASHRLAPGTILTQAHAQLNTVMDAIRLAYPQFTQNATALVLPMKDVLLDGVGTKLRR